MSAGVIEGGDGSGWGMGYGFDGKKEVERERERRRSAGARKRHGGNPLGTGDEGTVGEEYGDRDDDKKTPASSMLSPFCEELPYRAPELVYAARPESGESRTALASPKSRIEAETAEHRRPYVLRHVSFGNEEGETYLSQQPNP